jgi:hypothetical protein
LKRTRLAERRRAQMVLEFHSTGLSPAEIASRINGVNQRSVEKLLKKAGIDPSTKGVDMNDQHWRGWIALVEQASSPERRDELLGRSLVQLSAVEAEKGAPLEEVRNRICLAAHESYEREVRLHESEGVVLALKDEFGKEWWNEWKSRYPKPPAVDGAYINRPPEYTDEVVPGSSKPEGEINKEKEARIVELAEERFSGDRRAAAKELLRRGEVTI